MEVCPEELEVTSSPISSMVTPSQPSALFLAMKILLLQYSETEASARYAFKLIFSIHDTTVSV